MSVEDSAEQRCAHLLGVRNPGWEVIWSSKDRMYRAWRLENGRPTPPTFGDVEPSRLEAQIRSPADQLSCERGPGIRGLDEQLRDALYLMRDRGLLPHWRPASEITAHVDP